MNITGYAVLNDNSTGSFQIFYPEGEFFKKQKSSGNYLIIDTDYANYALIYSCDSIFWFLKSQSAWILSRNKTISQDLRENLTNKLDIVSTKVARSLISVDQVNCQVN